MLRCMPRLSGSSAKVMPMRLLPFASVTVASSLTDGQRYLFTLSAHGNLMRGGRSTAERGLKIAAHKDVVAVDLENLVARLQVTAAVLAGSIEAIVETI